MESKFPGPLPIDNPFTVAFVVILTKVPLSEIFELPNVVVPENLGTELKHPIPVTGLVNTFCFNPTLFESP